MEQLIRTHLRRKKGGSRKCVLVEQYVRTCVTKLRAKGRKAIYPDLEHIRIRARVRERRARAKECAECRERDLLL